MQFVPVGEFFVYSLADGQVEVGQLSAVEGRCEGGHSQAYFALVGIYLIENSRGQSEFILLPVYHQIELKFMESPLVYFGIL